MSSSHKNLDGASTPIKTLLTRASHIVSALIKQLQRPQPGYMLVFFSGIGALTAVGVFAWWAVEHVALQVQLPQAIPVHVNSIMPFSARFDKPLPVKLDDLLAIKVSLNQLSVPIDETLHVPVHFDVDMPFEGDVAINQELDLALDVPINMILTERELDLSRLQVPIDTEIFIEDKIAVDFVLPIDTQAQTLLGVTVPVKVDVPIHTKVPVKQKVRVRDTVDISVRELHVPLHATVPVKVKVPVHQTLNVQGTVRAPIRANVPIHLQHTIRPKMTEDVDALVRIRGEVPAKVDGVHADVQLDKPVDALIAPLSVSVEDLSFKLK